MIAGEVHHPPKPRVVEIRDPGASLYAASEGLFDRALSAGQDVTAGDFAGWFHHITEPERPSVRLTVPQDGMILAHTNRGLVTRGEMLLLVVQDVDQAL
jgi:predicted deacylase